MKLTHSTPVKVIAIILLIISLAATVGGVVGIALFYDLEFYSKDAPEDFFDSDWCEILAHRYANEYVYWHYLEDNADWPEGYVETLDSVGNFYFEVYNSEGRLIATSHDPDIAYGFSDDTFFYEEYSSAHQNYDATFNVKTYIRADLAYEDEFYYAAYLYGIVFSMRYAIFAIVAACALISILLFVFLMYAAGKKKGRDEPVLSWLDKIPLDLLCALYVIGAIILLVFVNDVLWQSSAIMQVFATVFFILAVFLLFLSFCMSFAVRAKCGTLWRNTLIFMILSRIFTVFRKIISNLNVIWKTTLIFVGICLIELFTIATDHAPFMLVVWFFGNFLLFVVLALACIGFNTVKKSGEKLSRGELSHKTDTKLMFGDIKRHAEDLNAVGDGMARALEEQMKSERFKTELITNVSHDIKTPLTSIINYVDLLKKEDLGNERAAEYIGIIERHSSRLKKLTEDLVEASKATTGNIAVSCERMNVRELLSQSVAEYSEKFAANSLEAIVNAPEKELAIHADGKLMWRVFDNLLANICKYSQSGTRVYFDLSEENGKIKIVFKNISRYSLNITTEALLERFVRGDSSRSTEGSGLGLSIAKSLVELQGGKLELAVDGDLFKVTIIFYALT